MEQTAERPARKTTSGQDRMLTVKTRWDSRPVPVRDVLYAESFGRKVILHLTNGQMEYYERIGNLERSLGDGFFRVHRSFLVNLDRIDRYTRNEIRMCGGGAVWISKYKYADFVRAYEAGKKARIA